MGVDLKDPFGTLPYCRIFDQNVPCREKPAQNSVLGLPMQGIIVHLLGAAAQRPQIPLHDHEK